MYEVSRKFPLQCSRIAPTAVEASSRVESLSIEVNITCSVENLDDNGVSTAFSDFDKSISLVVDTFKHRYLNEILRHPSYENLAREIFSMVLPVLPEVACVEIEEAGVGKVCYRVTGEA